MASFSSLSQHAGVKDTDSLGSWVAICKDYLDLACWVVSGDYKACILSSVAGRAVFGAESDDLATMEILESFDALVAFMKRRASRFIRHGDGESDGFVNPDPASLSAWNTPAALRAASVTLVGVATLSLFMQVRTLSEGCFSKSYSWFLVEVVLFPVLPAVCQVMVP